MNFSLRNMFNAVGVAGGSLMFVGAMRAHEPLLAGAFAAIAGANVIWAGMTKTPTSTPAPK
jgi:hypothetical protein